MEAQPRDAFPNPNSPVWKKKRGACIQSARKYHVFSHFKLQQPDVYKEAIRNWVLADCVSHMTGVPEETKIIVAAEQSVWNSYSQLNALIAPPANPYYSDEHTPESYFRSARKALDEQVFTKPWNSAFRKAVARGLVNAVGTLGANSTPYYTPEEYAYSHVIKTDETVMVDEGSLAFRRAVSSGLLEHLCEMRDGCELRAEHRRLR